MKKLICVTRQKNKEIRKQRRKFHMHQYNADSMMLAERV